MISNILKNIGYNDNEIIDIIKKYDLKEYDKEKDLEKLFTRLGYTNKKYNKIINTYPISNLTSETLYYKVVEIYFTLLKLNCTDDKIIKMTTLLPALYGLDIENIKNKIKDMMDIGYTLEEVIQMTTSLPSLLGYSIENIKEKIDFYKEIEIQDITLTYTKRLIQSIALSYARYMFLTSKGIIIDINNYTKLFYNQKKFASLYGVTTEELVQMYDYNEYKNKENEKFLNNFTIIKNILKNIGYEDNEIIDIIKKYDLKEYDKEKDLEKLFTRLGYTNKKYNKIINTYPISNLTSETLYYKLVEIYFGLLKLNYKNEMIIKMTTLLPALYAYSIENIKNKIKDMMDIGYTLEELIKMTQLLPSLLGYNIENIKEKINFYKEVGIQDIILTDTKRLMQSVALSYARYMFLTSKGIIIDINNYIKLFHNQKKFTSQYGVTTEELLQMYDYNEYKEKRKNERNLQLKLK